MMRNILTAMMIILFLGGCTHQNLSEQDSDKMEFWRAQKKGANMNLTKIRPLWFEPAQNNGFQFIRFNVSWLSGEEKDFLIGDVDEFSHIVKKDLDLLMEVLDEAESNKQKIVLAMFELPGCRDGNSDGIKDYRIWQDESYQKQAFQFWKELAFAVKDHPAIVAYNPLNEPHPELAFGHEEADQDFLNWLDTIVGTTTDLNRFNRLMHEAIREVDPDTPIMLEGYFYSGAEGLPYMKVLDDPAILYSFHNPAPWQFAAFRANKGRYEYPENMPEYWDDPGHPWTKENLNELLIPVKRFIADNNLESHQIVASEIWCDRRVAGCDAYFRDIFSLYNQQDWHWAFYAFREDMSWTGLDYELGSKPVPAWYWDSIDKGADYNALKEQLRLDNSIWSLIQSEFHH